MGRVLTLLLLTLFLTNCQNGNQQNYTTTGTIEAYQIDVRAPSPGKILYSNIPEGSKVNEDQLLAVIDTTDLHLQKEQLYTKLASMPMQLQSLENREEQLQIKLEFLNKQVERLRRLVEANGVSQDKLDELLMERDVAESRLKDIPTQRRSILNQQEQLTEQVELLNYRIGQARIVAPAQGTVLERYVESGEQLQPGHLLTTIGLTDTVWTMVYLPEPLLSKITPGQSLPIVVDGRDDTLNGTIEWIGSEAEFTPKTVYTEDTRTSLTYAVRVSIPNSEGILKIGMPVTVEIDAEL